MMNIKKEMADIESQITNRAYEEVSDVFHKRKTPVTLKFDDIVYKVKIKMGGLLDKNSKKGQEKVILKGVSGMVQPGEMVAMLGPSGSGKTTLLTALGGRLGGKLYGKITYNGQPFTNSMKRNTGFVTQDDFLYPHLTVTETLVFTALLRLPNTVTKDDKITQAKAVMEQLGLTRCKDSIIGGPDLRGVSGGERKRVSVGQELLINPSLLFLDEPTSGLDSTTALRIVSTLWELARGGRTIVMTIHQPSSRLYYMFHKVLLLSQGNTLYFGQGSEAMDYFASIGYAPALAMNPADFLLDLANGIYTNELNEDCVIDKQQLVEAYKGHVGWNLKPVLQEITSCVEGTGYGKWPTTWWQQFSVLLRRDIKERKHQAFSFIHMAQVFLVAIISGLLWYKSDTSHLQDQIGLLFFISSFWNFVPLFRAIFVFPREKMMLEKERSSGMYRLSSYYMSRMVADLPMELTLPAVFITITYWMAGLKTNVVNFLFTLLSALLLVMVSQGFGLAVGAVVQEEKSASTVASVIGVAFMLASGFFVRHVPKFMSWVKYVSIMYYVNQLLLMSQFHRGETYPCASASGHCLVEQFPNIKEMGFTLHDQLKASLALFAMLIIYRVIAYLALLRIGVTKKLPT